MTPVLLTHPCDVDILARLHATSFTDLWSADWIARLMAQPGTYAYLVDGDVGGFILARVAGDEAEVLTLAVVPAARRRGIGTILLRAAAEKARQMGAETMFLEVAQANEAAKALYIRLGFAEVARRRGYYGDKVGDGGDAVILSVKLPLIWL
ncbi:MAG: ribosomal protein S18-alanine N-acetyltransferase [Alphaproteobacteria bacterium]|nr:ribosomal protein S18-alanine N-acetyltransferase [Alphaproteobacteria bacterium]MDE1985511.1 ribosomal protein S18-alanine N-acetyltransferase [Alphaproteobacteria bacterium]MDE2161604.1 ribosomal protein S18-alanine N-acetyltransferase [Alphaproteobacteria bacterium]MDE2267192.1 ribosomal protein S18-alanine N-acetyltransferase [Alphaproteobacteria bacterium]MDE2499724.1 ribosomal protein S18-alanine N-acetyltransferase [Alphaproteobacteria bacterium]